MYHNFIDNDDIRTPGPAGTLLPLNKTSVSARTAPRTAYLAALWLCAGGRSCDLKQQYHPSGRLRSEAITAAPAWVGPASSGAELPEYTGDSSRCAFYPQAHSGPGRLEWPG